MSEITFRRPTFKNPLPVLFSYIWLGVKGFGKALISSQERLGRAKAAQHLAAMGYYEEAKQVMLEGERKC